MSENLADQAIRPSYEGIRDGVPDSGVREAWRAGDEAALRARTQMQGVHENEALSEEGKKHEAARVIDRSAYEAQEHYGKARKAAEKGAQSAYAFSVPMPDGGALATSSAKDSSEIVAGQTEAERIVQKLSLIHI